MDVKLFGVNQEDRKLCMWKPCHKCGWSNEYGCKYIDEEELVAQLAIHRQKKLK
jgi:hypothetical protein